MTHFQEKLYPKLDPISKKEFEEIGKKLEKEREVWEKKADTNLSEQADAIKQLSKIQDQIQALKPPIGAHHPQIDYDSEKMLSALIGLIKVRDQADDCQSREKSEEVLLCKGGLRFDLRTGQKEEIKFDRVIPPDAATFQINRKFHVCGGEAKINGKTLNIAELFSIDYFGTS